MMKLNKNCNIGANAKILSK